MNWRTLPLSTLEAFVLTRIDGQASIADLSDVTAFEIDQVAAIVVRLVELGAAEWAANEAPQRPRSTAPVPHVPVLRPSTRPPSIPVASRPVVVSVPSPDAVTNLEGAREERETVGGEPTFPRAPTTLDPTSARELASEEPEFAPEGRAGGAEGPAASATPAPTVSEAPPEPPPSSPAEVAGSGSDDIELPLERRKRIDELYPVLELLSHYETLGLARDAEAKRIRSAYFELSKVFHPDTAFRKRLGPYKSKMEAIFKRLTEAYEVLSRKKSRAEYDAYLSRRDVTRGVEAAINDPPSESDPPPAVGDPVPASPEALRIETDSVPPEAYTDGTISDLASETLPPSGARPNPSEPSGQSRNEPTGRSPSEPTDRSRSEPTDSMRRRARELMLRRLGRRAPSGPSPEPAEPMSRDESLKALATSLRGVATVTGGGDPHRRALMEAQRAEESRNLALAAQWLHRALAIQPTSDVAASELKRVTRLVAAELASQYREQARYEETHRKWADAARSWSKVVDGCPDDVEARLRGASALLECSGSMARAQEYAQRACELEPENAIPHRILGRVYLATGRRLRAKRELERAATLDPADEIVKNLLRELA